MDLATGTTPQSTGPPALRAVPDAHADARAGADALTAALEESDDVSADVALLRDAATLVTAYRSLGSYLVGPGALALAAYERVSASTVRGS
jgi:hypothetical protein